MLKAFAAFFSIFIDLINALKIAISSVEDVAKMCKTTTNAALKEMELEAEAELINLKETLGLNKE